jgi:hypothetical protein
MLGMKIGVVRFGFNGAGRIAILFSLLIYLFAFGCFCLQFKAVMKRAMRGVSILIDKLTHSIEDAKTGQRFETRLERLFPLRLHEIIPSQWLFDWKSEILMADREVFKLVRVVEPKVIQGLVSLEIKSDHILVHLIENALFNQTRKKKYLGVAGNLFAFACKVSFELGFQGYVAFE